MGIIYSFFLAFFRHRGVVQLVGGFIRGGLKEHGGLLEALR
jgi:hypothetical protein